MPVVPESKPAARRPARGVEPLRRSRVQPVVARSPRGRRILNAVLAFATVVMLVDALVGEKGLMERMRVRREYQMQERQLNGLKSENAGLRDRAIRLRNDPSAIEAIAREELGLILPGELLFILRDVKLDVRDSKPIAN